MKLEQNKEISLFQAFGEFSMVAKNTDKFISISADSNRIYLAHNKATERMIDVSIETLKGLKKTVSITST